MDARVASRTSVVVEDAVLEDVFGIVETLMDAKTMSDTDYPPPDMPYAAQYLLDQIANGMIAVARRRDEVVGCIVLDYRRWPWKHPDAKDAIYLGNDHFWVYPTARRGGTARDLLNWAKARAAALGLPLMMDLATLDSNVKLKDRFVANQGFVYLGGKFLYTPSSSSSAADLAREEGA